MDLARKATTSGFTSPASFLHAAFLWALLHVVIVIIRFFSQIQNVGMNAPLRDRSSECTGYLPNDLAGACSAPGGCKSVREYND